jgi:hypothetical protein
LERTSRRCLLDGGTPSESGMSSGPSEPIQTSAKGERQDVGRTEERVNGEKVKRRRREDES